MKESLLNFIICPKCNSDFSIASPVFKGNEIESGELQCTNCGETYPITNGIPRILKAENRKSNYSDNFKMYWKSMDWNYSELYKKRFYEMYEWKQKDFESKTVLEAGCGGGRWAYQFAQENVKEIIAFDYTEAVDKAKEICAEYDNIHYVQADIFELPFKKNRFDIVHCHGVLHATPDIKQGTINLSTMVAPRGELVILIYRNLTSVQKLIDDVLCFIPKRLPIKFVYYTSMIPTLIEYIPGAVKVFENIFHLSGQPNFTLKHLHNFDWFSSKYRSRTSLQTVETWLEGEGFVNFHETNTNHFRTDSKHAWIKKIKMSLLKQGIFLKATLGIRIKRK